jgi:hypothetical protein
VITANGLSEPYKVSRRNRSRGGNITLVVVYLLRSFAM